MSTSIDSLNAFCSTPLDELLRESDATGDTHPPDAVAAAVRLHQHAVERVPAYAKLVDSQTPEDVKGESSSPLNQIPFLDKASYIGVHNLDERSTGGTLDSIDFIHCSSGSTGTPTFWGRAASDELISSVTFEQFFRYNFLAHERSTLCIVAFPLGAWVGGIFTLDCLRFLTLKGYKLTTVAPGNKVADIVNLARKLAPSFQQTVLLGYPPFVKAAVDRGMEDGMDWSGAQTKLVLAGEVVSEEWKQLMGRRCGMEDASRDIVSMYGTADAGCVACETALSGAIRSWASQHPAEARMLFGQDRLPTLCQYNPYQRLLELSPHDGTLVLTTLNDSGTGAPLIRYCIGDSGGLRSFSDMVAFLQQHGGQDLLNRFQLGGASDAPASKAVRQPFVWVFGRSFWTVSLYGANVYVENIMVAMQQPHVAEHVTSKFILFVEEDENLDKRLAVRVELSKAAASGSEELRALIAREVLSNLRRVNSEYCNYVPPEKQEPVIHLHQMGDPTYFPVGVKHKYTLLH